MLPCGSSSTFNAVKETIDGDCVVPGWGISEATSSGEDPAESQFRGDCYCCSRLASVALTLAHSLTDGYSACPTLVILTECMRKFIPTYLDRFEQ